VHADCGLRIAAGEEKGSGRSAALGLYVHIPFCPQHCPYCAFAVLTGHRELYDRYVEAVCAELRHWHHLASRGPLSTIYFGGGTPSMLEPAQLRRMVETAESIWGIAADAEITLEANPSTADSNKFAALIQCGFNRLSLGVQSFTDSGLKALGRLHSAAEAETAFIAARRAGFTNVNIDLIFSIPGASRSHWRHSVDKTLALQPEHISTYSLTIEEGTRFAQRYHRGRLRPVTEEDDAWAYAWVMDTLEEAGYEHYEVSNFARPGYRSRHNWGYWFGATYVGVGLGAHSFVDGQRRWNTRDMRAYLATIAAGHSPCTGQETIAADTARQEQILLQLRTSAGVCLDTAELLILQRAPQFLGMLQAGLVACEAQQLRLTRQGFLLADSIALEIVAILESATPRQHLSSLSS
jgi:oxygen-independent coproporphyrinogen III oxidase